MTATTLTAGWTALASAAPRRRRAPAAWHPGLTAARPPPARAVRAAAT